MGGVVIRLQTRIQKAIEYVSKRNASLVITERDLRDVYTFAT